MSNRNPTVLWVGDAGVPTGFARCTDNVCNHLHEQGWIVHVLGINYYGNPDHGYPFDIWPPINYVEGCPDQFGLTRLPKLIDKIQPDIVVLLGDTWNVGAYMDAVESCQGEPPPVVSWLAVDAYLTRQCPALRFTPDGSASDEQSTDERTTNPSVSQAQQK